MTPEQLAEIRARAETATPGPWDVYAGWVGLDGEALNPFFRGIVAVLSMDGDGNNILVRTRSDYEEAFEYPANAAFMAHARTDIPALLDYIERLQVALNEIASLDFVELRAHGISVGDKATGIALAALQSKEGTNE